MGLLDLLILAIATWRVSYLVTREDAPFQLAAKFRARFPLGGLTECIYCTSVWVAAALYLLWLTPAQPVVTIIAVSGAALMLGSYTGANHA
jgi:hypothetical protein